MSYSSPPAAFKANGLSSARPSLSWLERCVAICAGLGLVTLLGIAAWLTPERKGMGTHQQLGLPPCSFVMWFGERCPACGMTTSWSCLMRGRIGSGLQANPGGLLLGLVALVSGPWLTLSGVLGRWFGGIPRESVLLAVALAITGVTVTHWMVRLWW